MESRLERNESGSDCWSGGSEGQKGDVFEVYLGERNDRAC